MEFTDRFGENLEILSAVESQPRVLSLIKKKTKILCVYKEIQKGAVAKSYMTNGLLIYV
jgi:hypothetical protein